MFYSPGYLFLLSTAIIVIFLHLLKAKPRDIIVSDKSIWFKEKGATRRSSPRINRLLSLLLSLLTVLFFTMGLSRVHISGVVPPKRSVLLLVNDTVELSEYGYNIAKLTREYDKYVSPYITYRDTVDIHTKSGIFYKSLDKDSLKQTIERIYNSDLSYFCCHSYKFHLNGSYDVKLWLPTLFEQPQNVGIQTAIEYADILNIGIRNWSGQPNDFEILLNNTHYTNFTIGSESTKYIRIPVEDINTSLLTVEFEAADGFELDNSLKWVSYSKYDQTPIIVVSNKSDNIIQAILDALPNGSSQFTIGANSFEEAYSKFQRNAIYIINDLGDFDDSRYIGNFIYIKTRPKSMDQYFVKQVKGNTKCLLIGELRYVSEFLVRAPSLYRIPNNHRIYSICTNLAGAFSILRGDSNIAYIGFTTRDLLGREPAFALILKRIITDMLRFRVLKRNYTNNDIIKNRHNITGEIHVIKGSKTTRLEGGIIRLLPQGSGIYTLKLDNRSEIFSVNYVDSYRWTNQTFAGMGAISTINNPVSSSFNIDLFFLILALVCLAVETLVVLRH